MAADGGGFPEVEGKEGTGNGGSCGPVSLVGTERAEEDADVNRAPLIGRSRPGGRGKWAAGRAESACVRGRSCLCLGGAL